MKIGTVVRNEYQGIVRYGKVNAIFKGEDSWTWCEVDWVDDEEYEQAIAYRNELSCCFYTLPRQLLLNI